MLLGNGVIIYVQYVDKGISHSSADDGGGVSHCTIIYDCKEKPRGIKSKYNLSHRGYQGHF